LVIYPVFSALFVFRFSHYPSHNFVYWLLLVLNLFVSSSFLRFSPFLLLFRVKQKEPQLKKMGDASEPTRLLLVGDANVGKTSLLNRLNGVAFGESTEDWDMKSITVPFGGQTRTVILTDTAGQERFRELTSASYKGADIIFVVFAVDDKDSFDHVARWLEECDRYVPPKNHVPRVIIANKVDVDDRKVSTQDGEAFASSKSLRYLETSAKTDKNVQEILKITLSRQDGAKEGGGCCSVQ